MTRLNIVTVTASAALLAGSISGHAATFATHYGAEVGAQVHSFYANTGNTTYSNTPTSWGTGPSGQSLGTVSQNGQTVTVTHTGSKEDESEQGGKVFTQGKSSASAGPGVLKAESEAGWFGQARSQEHFFVPNSAKKVKLTYQIEGELSGPRGSFAQAFIDYSSGGTSINQTARTHDVKADWSRFNSVPGFNGLEGPGIFDLPGTRTSVSLPQTGTAVDFLIDMEGFDLAGNSLGLFTEFTFSISMLAHTGLDVEWSPKNWGSNVPKVKFGNSMTLSGYELQDEEGDMLADQTGFFLGLNGGSGDVTEVAEIIALNSGPGAVPVPVPGAAWLLAGGIGALTVVRRKAA